MFKFLLLGVILSQVVCKISAKPSQCNVTIGSIDTPAPNLLPTISEPNSNDTDIRTALPENYIFHGTHQIIYMNAPHGWKSLAGLNSDNIGEEIRSDYTVTDGIGAHKVHRRKLSWNEARKTCVEEGGHLAIIRTEAEETIIRRMMVDSLADNQAWVGYHDQFKEGDWFTVLDEPIAKIPWTPWSKKFPQNPDNAGGNENCGALLKDHGGINDDKCDKQFSFICKITTS